jgi:hypothetical protein
MIGTLNAGSMVVVAIWASHVIELVLFWNNNLHVGGFWFLNFQMRPDYASRVLGPV